MPEQALCMLPWKGVLHRKRIWLRGASILRLLKQPPPWYPASYYLTASMRRVLDIINLVRRPSTDADVWQNSGWQGQRSGRAHTSSTALHKPWILAGKTLLSTQIVNLTKSQGPEKLCWDSGKFHTQFGERFPHWGKNAGFGGEVTIRLVWEPYLQQQPKGAEKSGLARSPEFSPARWLHVLQARLRDVNPMTATSDTVFSWMTLLCAMDMLEFVWWCYEMWRSCDAMQLKLRTSGKAACRAAGQWRSGSHALHNRQADS